MRLEGKQINNVVVVGENNTQTARINEAKIGKLQYLLTNGLYSDGIGSTIVEITNNALDSIIQSGKDPMENPVYVYIETNAQGKYQLRITDNGLGLDEDEFSNVVMNYLTSTKEEDDDVIGAFGIGAKSWCSVSNTATFICRKDGVERSFLCYKGDTFLKYDKLYEKETEEENGVTFILPIKDYSQKYQFETKAKQKLAYYDNVILTIDKSVVPNTIYRSELFQWSTMSSTNLLHFSLKDVYYTLNFEALGIDPIYVPVCLRFTLKEGIMPTPSREQIIYTDETKQLILDKIRQVAHYFRDKYNNAVGEYETIWDAWENIDSDDKVVNLEGKRLVINDLLEFADLEVNEPKIKGVEIKEPVFYKKKYVEFFYDYIRVAYIGNSGAWKKKETTYPTIHSQFEHRDKIVLLPNAPVGRFKTFLGEKYGLDTLFVVKREKGRVLGHREYNRNSYYNLLELKAYKREEWRKVIQEWQGVQKTFTDKFEDATQLENSVEYAEWLQERKEEQKAARQNRSHSSNYKALNKQEGEITVNMAREFMHGGKAVFDKGTVKIQDLHKLGHLTVYFTKAEADENKDLIYKLMKALPAVKFAWLIEREIKFVKDLKTWCTKEQLFQGLQTKKEERMFSKPLKRYITANLIDEYLELIPNTHEEMIYSAFPNFEKMKNELKKYAKENAQTGSYELFKELKATAIQNNLLDEEIYPLLQEFKKIMDDFGFLAFLKPPYSRYSGYTEAEKKVLNNIIYVMLKNKKVTCTMIDEFELVPKAELVEPEDNDEVEEDDIEEGEGYLDTDFDEEEEEEEEDELPPSYIVCDKCGNAFHKYLISETDDGDFCENCNEIRSAEEEEELDETEVELAEIPGLGGEDDVEEEEPEVEAVVPLEVDETIIEEEEEEPTVPNNFMESETPVEEETRPRIESGIPLPKRTRIAVKHEEDDEVASPDEFLNWHKD